MTEDLKLPCHKSGFQYGMSTSVFTISTLPDSETPCSACGVKKKDHPLGKSFWRTRLQPEQMTPENFERLKRDLLDAQAVFKAISDGKRDGYLTTILAIGDYWLGLEEPNPDWKP